MIRTTLLLAVAILFTVAGCSGPAPLAVEDGDEVMTFAVSGMT